MKIHGIFYLIIGIGVIIISSRIEKFTFFIVIGALMIFIGLIKLITGISKKEIIEDRQDHKIKRNSEDFVTCKFCKAYNYPNAIRCHHCGRRMK